MLRRVLPNGTLLTVAGKGPVEGAGGSGEIGSALESLIDPAGFTIEASGNIVIADPTRHRLRRINTNAGTIDYLIGTGLPGFAGDGGPGEAATLNGPVAVATDGRGNLIFADRSNHRIRRIAAGGNMETLAGRGRSSADGALALDAVLTFPEGTAVGADGTAYVADTGGHCVKAIGTNGRIRTFAGLCGSQGIAGDGGPAAQSKLTSPTAITISREGFIYIADTGNDCIRRVSPNGNIATVAGGLGLVRPRGLAIDPDDQYLYFTNEFEGSRISRHQMNRPGDFQTFAGGLGRVGFSGDGGAATFAVFDVPSDVAMDRQFTLWIMDRGNGRLRKIDRSGLLSTVALVPGGQRLAVDAAGSVLVTQASATEHRVLRFARLDE